MPSIQDFRNMVGQYSEGYVSMTNDASGNQQLSKVANHRTFTFLNPSESKVKAMLGGVAAQNVRQALADAIRNESQDLLDHPAVRKILYGTTDVKDDTPFSSKPLSRREVRQVFEVLDLQKLFAKAGVAITKDDLGFAENELFRVKDDCKSAFVKTISLLLPPQKPGKAPVGCLTPAFCALLAEKSVALHKAFFGKTDAQITNELLWKTIFDEKMPENALEGRNGKAVSLVNAMTARLDEMFKAAVDSKEPDNRKAYLSVMAQVMAVSKGLNLSGALKLLKNPAALTKADFTPGAPVFLGKQFTRSSTVNQLAVDVPRASNLTFGILHQIRDRPASMQEYKLSGNVSVEDCKTCCNTLDSEIQHIYADKLLHATQKVCTIPPEQLETILAFGRQDADNLLVYPGTSGITDKQVLVKANDDGTVDVLVSCRVCGQDRPGSTALCRVYADGKAKVLDLALAQDPGPMVRKFISNGAF